MLSCCHHHKTDNDIACLARTRGHGSIIRNDLLVMLSRLSAMHFRINNKRYLRCYIRPRSQGSSAPATLPCARHVQEVVAALVHRKIIVWKFCTRHVVWDHTALFHPWLTCRRQRQPTSPVRCISKFRTEFLFMKLQP